MEARLHLAVRRIFNNQQRFIEEHLFGFTLADTMLIDAFSGVTLVPLETGNTFEIEHRILP